MKLTILIAILYACLAAPLQADETPRTQLYGGFAADVLRAPSGTPSAYTGWTAAVEYRAFWRVSAVADFAGYLGRENEVVDTGVHTFLFGPRVYLHWGRFSPFVEVLLGTTRLTASSGGPGFSANAFTVAAGGGLDARITPRWSVRVVQFDYERRRFFNEVPDGGRVSAGVLFRFGR